MGKNNRPKKFELNSELLRSHLRKRTIRSFSTAVLSISIGIMGWFWLINQRVELGTPWPLRRVLELNGKLAQKFFNSERMARLPPAPPPEKKPRFNGNLGLRTEID